MIFKDLFQPKLFYDPVGLLLKLDSSSLNFKRLAVSLYLENVSVTLA